jgi:DNA polymerase-3 subunit delta'
MPFENILGHKSPVGILRSMLKTGQIPHSFIFSGPDGIGKRTTAVAFVKAMNCMENEDDFCDSCISCRKIDRLVHPDLFCLAPEKNVLKIEQVRALQQDIDFKPMEAKKKAVIIDQADKLNLNAANCLLKTLEEPPEDTVLILIAQSAASMLPTVISRCQRIRFSPLADEDIFRFLRERDIAEDKAMVITTHAHGSIARANVLTDGDFLSSRVEIVKMLSGVSSKSFDAVFQLSNYLSREIIGLPLMLEFLYHWYRDLLFIKEGLSESLLYNRDIKEDLFEAAQHETRDGIIRKIKRVQWVQNSAVLNIDIQLGFESIMMQ